MTQREKHPETAAELPEWIVGGRPMPAEYADIIAKSSFETMETPFSEGLLPCVTGKPFDQKRWSQAVQKDGRMDADAFCPTREAGLTQFGRHLETVASNGHFINLACGRPADSPVPLLLAHKFGAAQVGVDINANKYRDDKSNRVLSATGATLHQEDVLHFLSTTEKITRERANQHVTFFLCGLQGHHQPPLGKRMELKTGEYTKACLEEMQRLAVSGDAIVLGPGMNEFNPEGHGFSHALTSNFLRNRDYPWPYHREYKLYVFEGDGMPTPARNVGKGRAASRLQLQHIIHFDADQLIGEVESERMEHRWHASDYPRHHRYPWEGKTPSK